eukprot:2605562-Pleurochrysis_carterae.AAC.1
MTCALNAANEKANELFRQGKFDFFGENTRAAAVARACPRQCGNGYVAAAAGDTQPLPSSLGLGR